MFPTWVRWSSVLSGSPVYPLNSLGTLPLLANDTAFYFTVIFQTTGPELFQLPFLSSTLFFSICINHFFTCSFNSIFTRLLRDLASLFPPLETLPFLPVLCAQHINTSHSGYCLVSTQPCVWSFSGKVWWKVKGEKGVMIIMVNSGRAVSWGLLWKGTKVKPERNW